MAECATQRTLKEAHMQLTASVSRHRTPQSRTNFDKTCQLTGTVCGPERRPHFYLFTISVTVQLWTLVLWVLSAYFNIRYTLPKCGPFLLGHPVYVYTYIMYIDIYIYICARDTERHCVYLSNVSDAQDRKKPDAAQRELALTSP
jgi:hypothetical protein